MNKLSTPLLLLLAPFAPCFNKPVHETFCLVVAAWIVCLGRRTISRVWQTTGLADEYDHSSFYRFFNQAVWNWDELRRVSSWSNSSGSLFPAPRSGSWSMIPSVINAVPRSLLAVSSSMPSSVPRKHKIFRFGVNWVTLGLVVQLPFRPDRCFCINLLWRVYSKEVKGLPHQTKSQLARQMVDLLAIWLPERTFHLVADSAYIGAQTPPRLASERPGGWPDPPRKPI